MEKVGLEHGLPGSTSSTFVNFQYVDDTLILGIDSVSEAIHIKWGLYYFEAWSDLRINFSKSSFICLGTKHLTINLILEIINCKEGKFPLKHLGIPIKPGKLFKEDWNLLLDCFEKKVESWRGNLLREPFKVVVAPVVTPLGNLSKACEFKILF